MSVSQFECCAYHLLAAGRAIRMSIENVIWDKDILIAPWSYPKDHDESQSWQ